MDKDRDAILAIQLMDDRKAQRKRIEAYIENVREEAVLWAANEYAGSNRKHSAADIMEAYAKEHGKVRECRRFYDDDGNEWDQKRTMEYLKLIDEYSEDLEGMTAIEFINNMIDTSDGPKYDGDETDEYYPPLCPDAVVISPDGKILDNTGYAGGPPRPFPVPSEGITVAGGLDESMKIHDMMCAIRKGVEVDVGTEEGAKAIHQMMTRGILYSTADGAGKEADWEDWDFIVDGTVVKMVEAKVPHDITLAMYKVETASDLQGNQESQENIPEST